MGRTNPDFGRSNSEGSRPARAASRSTCFWPAGEKRRAGSSPATVAASTGSRRGTRTSSATAMLAASVPRGHADHARDLDEAAVAAEHLVAAGAGQGDRDAGLTGRAADEVGVDAVEGGLVDGGEGGGELLLERAFGQGHRAVVASNGVGHRLRVTGLVVVRQLESDREGVQGAGSGGASHRG